MPSEVLNIFSNINTNFENYDSSRDRVFITLPVGITLTVGIFIIF